MVKAYIIIDFQNDYFPGGRFLLKDIEVASSNAARFLQFAREQGESKFKIIHIRHINPSANPLFFEKGTKGSETNQIVEPIDDEPTVFKHHPNSFVDTKLNEILKDAGITDLVVSGAMSNVCVQGTVRHASEIGYNVLLLKDAVATREFWEFEGETVDYKAVNTTVFATLKFRNYATLISTDEAIKIHEASN